MIHWDRYIAIIGRITQRPECWNQVQPYYAGGCGCVGAHARIDSGQRLFPLDALAVWIGFTNRQACWIYSGGRTLDELQQLAITQKFPWERAQ